MKPNHKVALVLGGIKGIGKAICLDLLNRGTRVAATWHDWPESLAAMQSDFARTGTDHLIERIDLLDTDAIPGLVERIMERFGRLAENAALVKALDELYNGAYVELAKWLDPCGLEPYALSPDTIALCDRLFKEER